MSHLCVNTLPASWQSVYTSPSHIEGCNAKVKGEKITKKKLRKYYREDEQKVDKGIYSVDKKEEKIYGEEGMDGA